MKSYTIVYFKAFGYDTSDWIGCEFCGKTAVDISHILPKSTWGIYKDSIEVLAASCRDCHITEGDLPKHRAKCLTIHKEHMENNGVKFDKKLILYLIDMFENE
jgi:hypothetical protein